MNITTAQSQQIVRNLVSIGSYLRTTYADADESFALCKIKDKIYISVGKNGEACISNLGGYHTNPSVKIAETYEATMENILCLCNGKTTEEKLNGYGFKDRIMMIYELLARWHDIKDEIRNAYARKKSKEETFLQIVENFKV